MPNLLVHGERAFTNEMDFFRQTRVPAAEAEVFSYKGAMPQELWRVEGSNGSMMTADFQSALHAFKMGGNRMVRIHVVDPDA